MSKTWLITGTTNGPWKEFATAALERADRIPAAAARKAADRMGRLLAAALVVTLSSSASSSKASSTRAWSAPNRLVGTWRMVEAVAEENGQRRTLYGGSPDRLLVFTEDLHFVEMLHDTTTPAFAGEDRTGGTAEENAAAVAGALGQYGTYQVDADGAFTGNTIQGSTFPNWSGLTRSTSALKLTVDGDTLTERLTDPGAPAITITYRRES